MKILLLSDPNSVHTIKWATSIADNNVSILIFGLRKLIVNDYEDYKNITIITIDNQTKKQEGSFTKVTYLKALPQLKKIIKNFNPDILHAHYASSYGFLGSLSGFSPFIISVWGSDVFSFPKRSIIHKAIIKYNLKRAEKILSTSNVMAKETEKYTTKKIEVTPFGIDIAKFKPFKVKSIFNEKDIVIGTVKTLEKKYGIDYLIKAFKIISEKHPNLPLKLLIVGGGSLKSELLQLTRRSKIDSKTIFTDNVPFVEVPNYHNMIDISVFPSIYDSESFGVAVLEASSCEKPVIVSNVGGLPEVVKNNLTGIVVPPKNEIELAKAIETLILNVGLRNKLGESGRLHVEKLYNWENNVTQMLNIYSEVIKKKSTFSQ